MKKHLNLMTVVVVAVAIASVLGHAKGAALPGANMFGFSSGG